MKSQAVTFENPPINEVIVSAYFNPPLIGLRSEHIGLFWREVKEDFPVVTQKVAEPAPLTLDEPFSMPRYWFIAKNEINIIQVQKNAFMLNWRLRKGEYPGFHNGIKPAFDKYYGLFSEFIQTETNIATSPAIGFCQLAYVNTLECCEYWSGPQDTTKVIPLLSIMKPDIDFSESLEFDCSYMYKISTDLQLRIRIRNGFKTQQPDVPVLEFEIRASSSPEQMEKPKADEWFNRAHDAIISCFLKITSPDIQNRLWKRVEKTQ